MTSPSQTAAMTADVDVDMDIDIQNDSNITQQQKQQQTKPPIFVFENDNDKHNIREGCDGQQDSSDASLSFIQLVKAESEQQQHLAEQNDDDATVGSTTSSSTFSIVNDRPIISPGSFKRILLHSFIKMMLPAAAICLGWSAAAAGHNRGAAEASSTIVLERFSGLAGVFQYMFSSAAASSSSTTTSTRSSLPLIRLLGGWLRRGPNVPVMIAAISFMPLWAILQGAVGILNYRIRFGDAPAPLTPSHGVVFVAKRIKQKKATSTATTPMASPSSGQQQQLLLQQQSSLLLLQQQQQQPPIRLLVIGDSLAKGIGQSSKSTPYLPEVLAKTLSAELGRVVYWTCHGSAGASTAKIVTELEHLGIQPEDTIEDETEIDEQTAATESQEKQQKEDDDDDDEVVEYNPLALQSCSETESSSDDSSSSSSSSSAASSPQQQQQQQQTAGNTAVHNTETTKQQLRITIPSETATTTTTTTARKGTHYSPKSPNNVNCTDIPLSVWRKRLLQHKKRFNDPEQPGSLGPYDIVVVITGSNDLKSAFFPFLLSGDEVELRQQMKQRGGLYTDELKLLIGTIHKKISLRVEKLRLSVLDAKTQMQQKVEETLDRMEETFLEMEESLLERMTLQMNNDRNTNSPNNKGVRTSEEEDETEEKEEEEHRSTKRRLHKRRMMNRSAAAAKDGANNNNASSSDTTTAVNNNKSPAEQSDGAQSLPDTTIMGDSQSFSHHHHPNLDSDLDDAMSLTRQSPLVVLPAMCPRSLPIFRSVPLRWLAIPIVDIMDLHKRAIARAHPGEVLFVNALSQDHLDDFAKEDGEYWHDKLQQETILNIRSIRARDSRQLEQDMKDYYSNQQQQQTEQQQQQTAAAAANEGDERRQQRRPLSSLSATRWKALGGKLFSWVAMIVTPRSSLFLSSYSSTDETMFAIDRIHPNDDGYDCWGRHIARSILEDLKKSQAAAASTAAE